MVRRLTLSAVRSVRTYVYRDNVNPGSYWKLPAGYCTIRGISGQGLVHSQLSLLRLRVLCLRLRGPATLAVPTPGNRGFQTGRGTARCWPGRTLCRHRIPPGSGGPATGLVEQFIAHRKPPRKLILDFDATDDPVRGRQPKRFFHGYYDGYCFLPLYVFCGQQTGELSAPRQPGWRPTCLGHSGLVGEAASARPGRR